MAHYKALLLFQNVDFESDSLSKNRNKMRKKVCQPSLRGSWFMPSAKSNSDSRRQGNQTAKNKDVAPEVAACDGPVRFILTYDSTFHFFLHLLPELIGGFDKNYLLHYQYT